MTCAEELISTFNINISLNMHLYDDIGDASSSLRGTISFYIFLTFELVLLKHVASLVEFIAANIFFVRILHQFILLVI